MSELSEHIRDQGRVNRHFERRITKMEVMLYLLLALSGLNLAGIRLLDSWYLLHP